MSKRSQSGLGLGPIAVGLAFAAVALVLGVVVGAMIAGVLNYVSYSDAGRASNERALDDGFRRGILMQMPRVASADRLPSGAHHSLLDHQRCLR